MLVNAKDMLNKAFLEKYAVCQFNINNLEWTRFILEECNKNNAPVILGVSEGAIKYMGGYKVVFNLVNSLINELKIITPVALHLDHGSSFDTCKKAVDAGFTSIMIDASKYPIVENLKITKKVVEYATKKISVEAEVGHVGGAEDEVVADIMYATVDDSVKITSSGIDFLAPALGSVHGLYKGEPKLNFERMKQIRDIVKIPLVLHGGTGIPDHQIIEAINSGIAKININTELQIAWTSSVRAYLLENPDVYDPRPIIKAGEAAIKEAVLNKLVLTGSQFKA